MLDPSNDFNSPCYDDTFRRVFFFDQYNDHDEYFIELDYWIMREAYTSRMGQELNFQQIYYDDAGGGENIFRDVSANERSKLQARKYFVGEERIDISHSRFGDIYKVTELYVCAPRDGVISKKFVSYESDICVFPQLKNYDVPDTKEFNINLGTHTDIEYLSGLNLVRVKTDLLEVGDEFYLSRKYSQYALTWYAAGQTSLMTVSSVSSDGWAVGNAVDFVNNGGSFTLWGAIYDIARGKGNPITLHVFSKTYPQRSLQVKIKKTTEFFDKNTARISSLPPPVADRFFPISKLSGIEAPEINSSTIPNFTEYKTMVENHSLINAKPSTIREIYPGLWLRETFETEAR